MRARTVQREEPKINDEKLRTKSDVANRAQVSLRTVNYWLASGQLPYCKIGRNVRILPSDEDAFFLSRRIGGRQ
ncbi:MAG: hypothetical protein C5B58_07320 [Acidobacteria bacterium]|nr:MAG: hypothetical protein C5B58_07320 [Acidobacteriota bacterium]